MQCPYCDASSTRVIDTREPGKKVRRRRECPECERRFTTYEKPERLDIEVVKKDGSKEPFNEDKIREGVVKSGEKTSISDEEIEDVVEEVKKSVRGSKEVSAEEIGQHVKKELKKQDEVAYLRFASVYDSFEDAESFRKEVEAIQEN